MADVEHVDITDPEIHEPKGVAAASDGEVYISDGAGSGAWDLVGLDSIDTATLYPDIETKIDNGTIAIQKDFWVSAIIPDVSSVKKIYVPVPLSCTVVGARAVLGAAISGANATVAFKDASGNSLGTSITVLQSGSAPGDGYTFTATTNQNLTGPTYITVETDGGSTDTAELYLTIRFKIVI